jgi:NAD(P)H-nitrite reductase large subunit
MSKIVIIGNSASGFSAVQALSAYSRVHEITVISQEEFLPYNKTLFFDFLDGKIKEKELFLCGEDYYEKNNISFMRSSSVNRIEPSRQRVSLKDNTRIGYDYLIIASGQKVSLPDIPGKTKNGVFAVYNLTQLKEIKERLSIIDAVCIAGAPERCRQFYESIIKKDKHVKVVSRPRPEGLALAEKAEWIDSSDLVEIIGEGAELKAYKLGNGKAIEASLILFVGPLVPSSEFLKDSSIRALDNYIIVDELMHTNFENIFACGSVCSLESALGAQKSWDEACNEGVIVAKNLIASLERGKTLCQQTS